MEYLDPQPELVGVTKQHPEETWTVYLRRGDNFFAVEAKPVRFWPKAEVTDLRGKQGRTASLSESYRRLADALDAAVPASFAGAAGGTAACPYCGAGVAVRTYHGTMDFDCGTRHFARVGRPDWQSDLCRDRQAARQAPPTP